MLEAIWEGIQEDLAGAEKIYPEDNTSVREFLQAEVSRAFAISFENVRKNRAALANKQYRRELLLEPVRTMCRRTSKFIAAIKQGIREYFRILQKIYKSFGFSADNVAKGNPQLGCKNGERHFAGTATNSLMHEAEGILFRISRLQAGLLQATDVENHLFNEMASRCAIWKDWTDTESASQGTQESLSKLQFFRHQEKFREAFRYNLSKYVDKTTTESGQSESSNGQGGGTSESDESQKSEEGGDSVRASHPAHSTGQGAAESVTQQPIRPTPTSTFAPYYGAWPSAPAYPYGYYWPPTAMANPAGFAGPNGFYYGQAASYAAPWQASQAYQWPQGAPTAVATPVQSQVEVESRAQSGTEVESEQHVTSAEHSRSQANSATNLDQQPETSQGDCPALDLSTGRSSSPIDPGQENCTQVSLGNAEGNSDDEAQVQVGSAEDEGDGKAGDTMEVDEAEPRAPTGPSSSTDTVPSDTETLTGSLAEQSETSERASASTKLDTADKPSAPDRPSLKLRVQVEKLSPSRYAYNIKNGPEVSSQDETDNTESEECPALHLQTSSEDGETGPESNEELQEYYDTHQRISGQKPEEGSDTPSSTAPVKRSRRKRKPKKPKDLE